MIYVSFSRCRLSLAKFGMTIVNCDMYKKDRVVVIQRSLASCGRFVWTSSNIDLFKPANCWPIPVEVSKFQMLLGLFVKVEVRKEFFPFLVGQKGSVVRIPRGRLVHVLFGSGSIGYIPLLQETSALNDIGFFPIVVALTFLLPFRKTYLVCMLTCSISMLHVLLGDRWLLFVRESCSVLKVCCTRPHLIRLGFP